MKNRFSTRLMWSIFISMLSLILIFSLIIDQMLVNVYYSKSYEEITRHNEMLVDMIQDNGGEVKSSYFTHEQLHGIVVLDENGKIEFEKNTKENPPPNLTESNWEKLQNGHTIHLQTKVEHHEILTVITPVQSNNKTTGYIMMITNSHHVVQALNKMRLTYALVALSIIGLALILTLFIVRKFTKPIEILEHATEKISKGDLSVRVEGEMYEELQNLSNRINEMAENLERFEGGRKEFFANISHELRTPITYLEGYLQVLKEESNGSQRDSQTLATMNSELNRMKKLVNDLFDLAQLEERRLPLYLEWVDLNEVCQNVVDMANSKATEKGMAVRYMGSAKELYYLDGMRMQQVLFNLVDNAIRYVDSGYIDIQLSENITGVTLKVCDQGPGIPKSDLPQLFERFYRVEKSRSRATGGSGLGLSIVKQLVELQGGTITVNSSPEEGTVFEIYFPKQQQM